MKNRTLQVETGHYNKTYNQSIFLYLSIHATVCIKSRPLHFQKAFPLSLSLSHLSLHPQSIALLCSHIRIIQTGKLFCTKLEQKECALNICQSSESGKHTWTVSQWIAQHIWNASKEQNKYFTNQNTDETSRFSDRAQSKMGLKMQKQKQL